MCIHKHATMCEEGHNFVDFFPSHFTRFLQPNSACQACIPQHQVPLSIEPCCHSYPKDLLLFCTNVWRAENLGTGSFHYIFQELNLGRPASMANAFTC